MGIFSKRNNQEDYLNLESFSLSLDSLLKSDSYLSKKELDSVLNVCRSSYDKLKDLQKADILNEWCRKNKVDYKNVKRFISLFDESANVVAEHNSAHLKRCLKEEKTYLDTILKEDDPKIRLDEDQRTVVLSDEDYTLVVAGAGAGKTTTIEAKVKYLVEKKNIDPSRILIVSLTRKATDELRTRFKKLKIPVVISTFHSIGNTIIKEQEEVHHKIVDNGFMFSSIKSYLTERLEDETFIRKILLFFASYLNMPFDEEKTALLFKTFAEDNITTLKSDIQKELNAVFKANTKAKITLKDERVRSVDECRIANFLYINGIDYIYEPVYQYGFKNSIKPYCPDFLLKQNGLEVYLEHFGLSESGKNNRFTAEELEKYKAQAKEKVLLHREHGTKLIYTYSKYNDGKDVISHLKEKLNKADFVLDKKDDIAIYRQIAKNAEDKYFNKFVQLICTFIGRFKVNNSPDYMFQEWKINAKDERTKLFLDICYQCYLVYKRDLKANNAIDFEDMINNAATVLDAKIANKEKMPFDYIFVDEYQDISIQRFDLAQKLSKASDAKIVAVGDDWQSIFRFTGSKVDLFTDFEAKMGYANILKITNTYRNSQELIDIAGGFVMENDRQIKKNLRSPKSIKNPIILFSYDDNPPKEKGVPGPYHHLGEAVEEAIGHIVSQFGQEASLALIGRYNFEGKRLALLDDLFTIEGDAIKSIKYPQVKIDFLTAHGSKGLGYDNVIIINGKDDVLGFPSKIEDDPIMKLVIDDNEEIDFAEERRLFYVALTRTKNRVYVIVPQTKPSKFTLELKEKYTNVELKGPELTPIEQIYMRSKCPICGYPLQKRAAHPIKDAIRGKTLWICSNDPEICGFMTNDLSGGKLQICKCSECEDGYLIVKSVRGKEGEDTGKRFLGCTNYKKDGTGCQNAVSLDGYSTEVKSKLSSEDCLYIAKILLAVANNVRKKRPGFFFIEPMLADYCVGVEKPMFEKANLYQFKEFGSIKQYQRKDVRKVFSLLVDLKVFVLDAKRRVIPAEISLDETTRKIIEDRFSDK